MYFVRSSGFRGVTWTRVRTCTTASRLWSEDGGKDGDVPGTAEPRCHCCMSSRRGCAAATQGILRMGARGGGKPMMHAFFTRAEGMTQVVPSCFTCQCSRLDHDFSISAIT